MAERMTTTGVLLTSIQGGGLISPLHPSQYTGPIGIMFDNEGLTDPVEITRDDLVAWVESEEAAAALQSGAGYLRGTT